MGKKIQWDGKSKGSIVGTRIFVKIIAAIGIYPAYAILAFVSLYYTLREKKTAGYLKALYGRLGLKKGLIGLWKHFYSFGAVLLDSYAFLLKGSNTFRIVSINEHVITDSIKEGKGVILLSAHLGNSEIAGNMLGKRLSQKINYVMLDAERSEMRKVLEKAFSNRKISVIPVNQDGIGLMIQIASALRNNEIVCMMGDRTFGGKGITTPFLGTPVEFPSGPFAVSAATGAPVIPIFAIKKGLRTYVFEALKPICIEKNKSDSSVADAVKKYAVMLEKMVKNHPYMWFNFYDYWNDFTTE
jgi:predicted LPLAT superfamily acyltransferase